MERDEGGLIKMSSSEIMSAESEKINNVPQGQPCSICNSYVHDLSVHPVTKALSCFLCISRAELD
jgi:hypothetical protein